MRPIKFRAWNKETKQMVDLNKITPLALAIDPSVVGAGFGVYVPDDNRLEIMQFTGLKDKNGKEIYEGDIIQSVSGKTWLCEWEGIGFDPFVANMEHSGDGWHYKVIGNVHSDPELLGEQK